MQIQVAQSCSISAENTVEHDMARRSRDRIYETLEAADALVDIGDPSEHEIALTRRVVEDLTSVIHDLVACHSAAVQLSEIGRPTMRCDACESPWPCQVYRAIHQAIIDENRCLEAARVLIYERRDD